MVAQAASKAADTGAALLQILGVVGAVFGIIAYAIALIAAGADLSRVHIVSAVAHDDGKGRRLSVKEVKLADVPAGSAATPLGPFMSLICAITRRLATLIMAIAVTGVPAIAQTSLMEFSAAIRP